MDRLMVEQGNVDAGTLNELVVAELGNEPVQEIDPNTYRLISEFIARLRNEEYDGVAANMKESLLSIVTEMATLLVDARMAKALRSDTKDYANLLDEEKRALDFQAEAQSARAVVLAAVLGGKPKILETISDRHKKKMALVVLRERVDALLGTDMRQYGPYSKYDLACLPLENAVALEAKGAAIKLRWADFAHDA